MYVSDLMILAFMIEDSGLEPKNGWFMMAWSRYFPIRALSENEIKKWYWSGGRFQWLQQESGSKNRSTSPQIALLPSLEIYLIFWKTSDVCFQFQHVYTKANIMPNHLYIYMCIYIYTIESMIVYTLFSWQNLNALESLSPPPRTWKEVTAMDLARYSGFEVDF